MRLNSAWAQRLRVGEPVRCAALFWSLVAFMPVGMGYLAFFLLITGMLVQKGRAERIALLRQHILFWPLAAYVAWILVVLVFQPMFYAETPSNLWHSARIAITLALVLALTTDEAVSALKGFMLAALCSVLVIAAHQTVGLPEWALWANLIHYSGNKSISNAVLLALVAASALVVAMAHRGRVRLVASMAALALFCVVVFFLPNRTSMIVVLGAPLAASIHQWRHHKSRLFAYVLAAMLTSMVVLTSVPAIQRPLAEGIAQARQAMQGKVLTASWNIRVQLARHTSRMIADRPWMGWGIGSWNTQWKMRAPPLIADVNMPHNDLLWMGAQAGVPGALTWLAIMLGACWVGWRRQDVSGRLAFVAALTLLFSALVNSATRDASIGLSLLWIVGLYLRTATEPNGRVRASSGSAAVT